MNTTNYTKGRSYCFHLDKTLYRDILHDAYLNWFEKTGLDLFDEPERKMMRIIKNTWRGYYIAKNKVINQKARWTNYTDPTETSNESTSRETTARTKTYYATDVTPEDIMIAKEIDEAEMATNSSIQLQIYLYAVQGYKPYEIAVLMGMCKGNIAYYFKKIRHIASYFN